MFRTHHILSLVLLVSLACVVKSNDILPPLITVSGTGEAKAEPTEVSVTVGIELRDKSVEQVSSETDSRSAAIISYLLSNGVADANVQTSYVNLQPYYSYQASQIGQLDPDYYTATKSITFLLKDLSLYDQIMTGLYDAGINSVSNVIFKIDNVEARKQQARKKAIANALSIAKTLVAGLGAKLNGVYSISDSSYGGNVQPIYYAQPMAMASYGMSASMASASYSSGPSIAGGEVTTTSTVSVSFYINNQKK